MASPLKTSASVQQQSSVQPSATLIEALHHRLCDPSIVPSFERCRSPHVTQRLITPRWVLNSNAEKIDAANVTDCKATSVRNNSKDGSSHKGHETNNEHTFNTVPKRNYLDIRIEQNTMFANEQCLRCQKKLAALSSTSPKSVEAINVNKKQIKKVIDSIQNHLNQGLAACPNHDGLVQVESELKLWLDRINGVTAVNNESSDSSAMIDTATAVMEVAERRSNNNTIGLSKANTQQQQTVKRRGAEGRAQAAIDDALVEKMFLQGGYDDNGYSNNNDDAVDTNNNVGDLKWVPPSASRVDESGQHRRGEHPSDRSRHHRRRSRSRSRSAERGDDRRKGKRSHRDRRRGDDRKRKKRRHRSRSRSMSRGSSSSSASLASRSISRDRSSKREHRRDWHSRKRRHKSSRRKGRKKSTKRHHSRRERSRSVSSSSYGADDVIEGRFEPPALSQPMQHKLEDLPVQREDNIEKRFVPPSKNGASDEIMQSEQSILPESRETIGNRFVPHHSSNKSKPSSKNEVQSTSNESSRESPKKRRMKMIEAFNN